MRRSAVLILAILSAAPALAAGALQDEEPPLPISAGC